MKITRAVAPFVLGFGLIGLSQRPVVAGEPHVEFLQGLREQGYGEMAVLYLEKLKATKVPAELTGTMELEFGLSKTIWAQEALTAEQANTRLNESQKHLEDFVKANPKHDSAPQAVAGLASMLSDRGQYEIRLSRFTKDANKQKTHQEAARKFFVDSRKWMAEQVKSSEKEFLDLKGKKKASDAEKATKSGVKRPVPMLRTKRKLTDEESELQDAEMVWLETRMNFALLDYYQAITYSDVAAKERKDLLAAGAKKFDEIYQGYRTTMVGVYSHMWHGRCLDEAGDIKNAIELYDEVLVAAGGGKGEGQLEDLFAQVEMFRLLLLKKKGATKEFAADAGEWLKQHSKMSKSPGYQGIALEYIKFQIEQSKELTAKAREDAFRKINKALTDITKVRSEYQQEAFLLKRQIQGEVKGGEDVEIASFEEGLAVSADAYQSARWADAVAAYTKTIALGNPAKDGDRLRKARYQMAYALLMTGKTDDAIAACNALIKENPNDPLSPQAGALKVQAALQVYGAAKDKVEPLAKLKTVAGEVINQWKTRPEADDARIALGQAMLQGNDSDGALSYFDAVQKESERYPQAQYYAGTVYWKKYYALKANKQADPTQSKDLRGKAVDRINTSVDGQTKQLKGNEITLPRLLTEARLLKGEMLLEEGKAAEAQQLLDPLAAVIVGTIPEHLAPTELRIILGSLRARVTLANLDDLEKTGSIAEVLFKAKGTDITVANATLVEYSKQVEQTYKKAQAEMLEAEKGDDNTKRTEAETKLEEVQKKYANLLVEIGKRGDLSMASRLYLAKSLQKLKDTKTAREQYEIITARAAQPGYLPAQGGEQAMIDVRSQLIGLLRAEGNFDEALKQADALVAQTKGASLPPILEKCRLMQAVAEKDPANPAKFDAAIKEWEAIGLRISKMQKKPTEYYDVILQQAYCMIQKGKLANDKDILKKAGSLLNKTLLLAPNLSGPEMVAMYKDMQDVAAGKEVKKKEDPLKVSAEQAARAGGGGGMGDANPMPMAKPDTKPAPAPMPMPMPMGTPKPAGTAPAPAAGAAGAKPAGTAPAPAAGAKPAGTAPAAGAKPAAAPATGAKPTAAPAKK